MWLSFSVVSLTLTVCSLFPVKLADVHVCTPFRYSCSRFFGRLLYLDYLRVLVRNGEIILRVRRPAALEFGETIRVIRHGLPHHVRPALSRYVVVTRPRVQSSLVIILRG